MNTKKLISLFSGVVAATFLSACTKVETFSTDKLLDDVIGTNTAKIKVTTNISNIFVIPNHSCITLDEQKVRKINTTFSRKISDDWAMWGKTDTIPIKEYPEKTIGMKLISLDQADEIRSILPKGVKSYSSYEYEVEANKPITFFIKISQYGVMSSYLALLLGKKSEELFALSASFLPEKAN